ncbi:Hypothetical small peptide [Latilactobacillus sakei subsp. sakei 23K]|nr:Hypothetical small peptide [Latilactobacillus sakei subsp. sakei 23K]
MMISSTD